MASGLLRGPVAGAAGTTALNAATYLDMAVRGRAGSSALQDLVEAGADRAGAEVPGKGDERGNRIAGLGPLSGTGWPPPPGSCSARCASAESPRPAPIAAVLIGAAAMASSDVPLKLLGISDPAEWEAKDWAADAVPHLVYGLVTCTAITAWSGQ